MRQRFSSEYLSDVGANSSRWRARKAALARVRLRRCKACGTRRRITCNHLSYKHLGNEPDRDLMWLCWPCHQCVTFMTRHLGFGHRSAAWTFVVLMRLARAGELVATQLFTNQVLRVVRNVVSLVQRQ